MGKSLVSCFLIHDVKISSKTTQNYSAPQTPTFLFFE